MHGIKKYLILTLMILLPINAIANSANPNSSGNKLLWITTAYFVGGALIKDLIPCIEIPKSPSFHTNSINLDLASQGVWIPTSAQVQKDKMLKFSWSTKGIKPRPRKYLVLYRIDPRFEQPQLFIQQWDYIKNKYTTDVPKLGSDISYYQKYFNEVARKTIRVEEGDVINITLIDPGAFFNSDNIFTSELDNSIFYNDKIYTPSNIDNKIIYSQAEKFCNIVDPAKDYCGFVGADIKYLNHNKFAFVGKLMQQGFNTNYPTFTSCPEAFQGRDAACFYDKGRGMKIRLNDDNVIKGTYESFIHSNITDVDFLYYKSPISGYLDITTDFDNMYSQYLNLGTDQDLSTDFVHFGRYALKIEIGSGEDIISPVDQDSIRVEYTISSKDSGTVDPNTTGINIEQDYKGDAYESGYLWVRVLNPHTEIQGVINVGYGYYTGADWVSNLIYNKIITPLREKFNNISKLIYIKLTKDATLKRIAQTMLTLYILIYGLLFLAGSVKITIMDIVTRVIKIAIIVALFSEDSWNFFNNNLFRVFIDGTDYLMSNITGVASSKSNIFGFIDPIYDKYTNSEIWSLLLIQLLQIHNGLCFFAIMVIYSIILYFKAVLEVVIGYIIAFLCMAVMISLAPFFIILMLFEQTRSLFDNWLSTLVSYVIQPTILFVFFLLIDQVMSEQLIKAVVRSCWDILVKIELHLSLSHIGIPFDISFSLPFLPGIPFFIPALAAVQDLGSVSTSGSFIAVATSSLLFCAYCVMCHGLVAYVTTVTQILTNVTPARKSGNVQSNESNPTESIIGDMKAVAQPVTRPIIGVAKTIYDKTIGGNYTKKVEIDDKKNYDDKLQESRGNISALKGDGPQVTKSDDTQKAKNRDEQ